MARVDYTPQLAMLVRDPPSGDEWLHEIKYDGYRIGCRVRRGHVTLTSRNNEDWTSAFPEIVEAARALDVDDVLLDGEVAVVLADGRTSFQALQNACSGEGSRASLVYFVFDLLRVDGTRLERLPLDERKTRLERLIARASRAAARIRYSDHVVGGGRAFFAQACRVGVEGIVSKRRTSPYRAGRHGDWVKTKCVSRQEAAASIGRSSRRGVQTSAANARSSADISVAGVRISHPDRVLYKEPRITKLELARYYERIADWIVPHVAGRPLTLVRCPEGVGGDCFYMKHSKVWAPAPLRRVRIQEKRKLGEYLIADDAAAVVGLVQMGVLEIHTWNSVFEDVERPNRIVIDLDPGARVAWAQVVQAARTVRAALAALDLDCYLKTTGGRGLHVVVPLVPAADWSECLAFSRGLSEAIERADPSRYTTAFARAGRDDRILIDYLRNNRTNTSVAAYSSRAGDGAPVSVPVAWAELGPALSPSAFTVASIPERLARRQSDPWKGYWTCRQRLTPRRLRAVVRFRL